MDKIIIIAAQFNFLLHRLKERVKRNTVKNIQEINMWKFVYKKFQYIMWNLYNKAGVYVYID